MWAPLRSDWARYRALRETRIVVNVSAVDSLVVEADHPISGCTGHQGNKAMLRTMQKFHGQDWTPRLEDQWRQAFDRVIEIMFRSYDQRVTV